MLNNVPGWAQLLTAAATFLGAVVLVLRLKPESMKVFVDNAKVSVEMSASLRDALRKDFDDLAERMRACETARRESQQRYQELELVLWELLVDLHRQGIDVSDHVSRYFTPRREVERAPDDQ